MVAEQGASVFEKTAVSRNERFCFTKLDEMSNTFLRVEDVPSCGRNVFTTIPVLPEVPEVDGELSKFINSENVCLRAGVEDDGEDMDDDGRSEKQQDKIYQV